MEENIKGSSLVFTGEGSLDEQTLQGKVVSNIIDLCEKHQKPLIILSGVNTLSAERISEIKSRLPNCALLDLVHYYGVGNSLNNTKSCISDLTEKVLCSTVHEFLSSPKSKK